MSLYTVVVEDDRGKEDLGFEMPYATAEDFAAQCNQRYGELGRRYSTQQAKRDEEVATDE